MKIAELFDVRGAATVITGGASGIGFACAEVMVDNGARVTILDRDRDALGRAKAALQPRSAHFATDLADVTDRAAVKAAVDRAAERYGRLDVVFANAGISGGPGFLAITGERNPAGAIENIPEGHWRQNLSGNLLSVVYTLQAAIPHMKKQGDGGSIIVTTSLAALKTENFVGSAYVAAKAGAAHLVRQTALELARHNIRVNAIAPGSFLTSIGGGRMHDPVVRRRFENANPMHRMASTEEIKGLALYLASPASGYVTGTQMSIDGGASAGMAD